MCSVVQCTVFLQTMYNKTILIRFDFCDVWNNQGQGKCYQPSRRPRLITLIKTLITCRYSRYPKNRSLITLWWIHVCQFVPIFIFLIDTQPVPFPNGDHLIQVWQYISLVIKHHLYKMNNPNFIIKLTCQSKWPFQGYFILKTPSVKKCQAE